MSRILPFLAFALLFPWNSIACAVDAETKSSSLPPAAASKSPAEELKVLQGSWKVSFAFSVAQTISGEQTPEIIHKLANDRLAFKIEENRLSFDCIRTVRGETVTLCNDLPPLESFKERAGADRLVLLTLENGKGLLASYRVDQDQLTLRYPAGCCSRSGSVIRYERVK